MRAVVQRVREASVTVEGQRVAAMGPGLLVLLGVGREDTEADVPWMVEKLAGLRIFEDAAGKMNLSVEDTRGGLIVVSQFTLYGDARKGKRPSFIEAMEPTQARALYARVCEGLRARGLGVGEGVFRADMQVALVNDGPVTLLLESPPRAAASPRPGTGQPDAPGR